jgi:hypothetical protein
LPASRSTDSEPAGDQVRHDGEHEDRGGNDRGAEERVVDGDEWGARTITVVPMTEKGDARYRVATRNGGAFVDDLAGGQLDERQFTVVGPVTMVVVAHKADDVIGCSITDDYGTLSVQSAMGLGAIVTCHGFVTT